MPLRPLTTLLILLAGPAIAACPGMTQLEMNRCAAEAFAVADTELNRVWGEVKPRVDAQGAGDALLDAQRKWIAFRDAACAAEAEMYAGGSIAPLIAASCLRRLTERRTSDLQDMVQP